MLKDQLEAKREKKRIYKRQAMMKKESDERYEKLQNLHTDLKEESKNDKEEIERLNW